MQMKKTRGTSDRKKRSLKPQGKTDDESAAKDSGPIDKKKRNDNQVTTGLPVQREARSQDVADHLHRMRKGHFNRALRAFHDLLGQDQVAEESVVAWVKQAFTDQGVIQHAEAMPRMFSDLIWAYRCAALHSTDPDGMDNQLEVYLSKLAPDAAAQVAAHLIRAYWDKPEILRGKLRQWIVRQPGAVDLTKHPGTAACLLNMLWNDGDFDTIHTLIGDNVSTSTPWYVDILGKSNAEGFYEGYVEPIEHLLGSYLHLVHKLYPSDRDPLRDEELDKETMEQIVALGANSPGEGRNVDANFAEGRKKIAGARKILQALAVRGGTEILTSYAAVLKSSLVTSFPKNGTIWGFEHVRFPYVHAVHATESGKHPVRMWEMWLVVDEILQEETYLDLMMNPAPTIKRLVKEGLKVLDQQMEDSPVEYAGLRDQETKKKYKEKFAEQCAAYLWVLAERSPAAKFGTAQIRGIYPGKYLGAFGCNAGLWWAKKEGMHVYYCLDGAKDEDVIQYKTRKTNEINKFLKDPQGKGYVDTITLAEVREILVNWKDLKGVVTFVRKGEFLTDKEVEDLIVRMEAADEKADQRQAPLRARVIKAAKSNAMGGVLLPDLNGPLFKGLTDEAFYSVVTQLLLLNTAMYGVLDGALASFLESKGAAILYDADILPMGFDVAYRQMIDEKNPVKKKERAEQLKAMVDGDEEGGVPAPLAELLKTKIDAVAALEWS